MARARVIETDTEAPPEADRLDGWPRPRETRAIFGHKTAEAEIIDAIVSRRLHHAWLMSGEAGIGKATFAYGIARFLLAQDVELPSEVNSLHVAEDDRTYHQVTALSHPGLLIVRRRWDAQGKKFRQSIAVDDIRALRHFLQQTAVTPWRVVIVDSADELNQSSANALLKSLEEPPRRTVFLLISSSPGRLLPTIRSRCRIVRFQPLDEEDLRTAVMTACAASDRDPPAPDQLDTLLSLSKGSPRRAMQLLDSGGLPLFKSILTLLESLPKLDRQTLHKLIALTSGRDGMAHNMAFDLLEDALADAIRAAPAASSARRSFPQLRRFPSLITPDSLADWAELWETIREARGETERLNLDKAALTLTAFERIERLSRKTASRGL